jgi:RNA polymerase sigma factor for flagellar operon FliA
MSAFGIPDEEAHALWARFATSREPGARARLIERYLPLARTIAARAYRKRADESVSFNDYLQYAHTGLIEAIDRYDPAREASFQTYSSHRIRGAILDGLAHESEQAAQRSYWRTRIHERMDSLTQEDWQNADLLALASLTTGLAIGFLLDQVDEQVDEAPCSNPYAATELAQLRREVHEAVGMLPERERQIIEMHYFAQQEFQSIASSFGVTKGRISQLHGQALTRIRARLESPPVIDRET